MADLVVTNTNSANDSEGMAFGLSGNLFVYLLGSMILSILLCTLLMVTGIGIHYTLCAGLLPVILTLAYLKIFKHNKPPHYQEDLFECWLNGSGHEKHKTGGGR
ncbi:MAG: hypothetical protein A2X48_12785 [Lentisphaerae bacterium GWF2_49_21]|nr:MAG: hypothetical protein A2X48_12785 [Lentisphaerae bacterium GWF2_49_21]